MGSKASLRTITWCKFSSKTMQDIPDTIARSHETHMTPCCKKFTVILSSQSSETVAPKRSCGRLRISLESTSACVYPDDCNFFIK